MLFNDSTGGAVAALSRRTSAGPMSGLTVTARSFLGHLDLLLHDFGIGTVPIGLLDQLTTVDLPHLNEAATFVIVLGDLQRRDDVAESEVMNLLEAALDVLAAGYLTTFGRDRIVEC